VLRFKIEAALGKLFGVAPSQVEGRLSASCLGSLPASQLAFLAASSKVLTPSALMSIGGETISIVRSAGKRSAMYLDKHDIKKAEARANNAWQRRLLDLLQRGQYLVWAGVKKYM
jgi:hypothetical protein